MFGPHIAADVPGDCTMPEDGGVQTVQLGTTPRRVRTSSALDHCPADAGTVLVQQSHYDGASHGTNSALHINVAFQWPNRFAAIATRPLWSLSGRDQIQFGQAGSISNEVKVAAALTLSGGYD